MIAIIKHLPTGEVRIVSLQEAALMAELDEADIAWAIEEHGVCATDNYEITEEDEKTREGASENNIVGDTDAEKPVRVVSPVSPCPPDFSSPGDGGDDGDAHWGLGKSGRRDTLDQHGVAASPRNMAPQPQCKASGNFITPR